MRKSLSLLVWLAVILVGTFAYYTIATQRHEPLNSGYLLTAALCTYAIGYRFYSKWIAARVLALDDRRATPCEVHEDGRDFVKTNKWIVFGHHFAAISGPGPLVGPVLAAQFGYLPGTLWILIGVVLGGAVQDMVILFSSVRRDGKSLAEMLKEELNSATGVVGLIAILGIMTVLLAVLALVVVNALAESPWGVFTVGATIPIAMVMGGYLRFIRIGKVLEISVFGALALLAAVWFGQYIPGHPTLGHLFHVTPFALAWWIIAYGLAASVLPIWLLLAPRDYLSTFMKLGTIFALVVGVFLVLPDLAMPAISKFADGTGLVVPGKIFPFCFITIACGSISGFHSLISSGVTPKIITRERYIRSVGYGAMLLESLVAMVAMIAACTLEPDVYLAMNTKGAGATAAEVAHSIKTKVEATGFVEFQVDPARHGPSLLVPVQVSPEKMEGLAREMGEETLFGRTGGAATLAVGMASIFANLCKGQGLSLWYHFAIMFEALFILTTLDAGTRVGRYLLQDALGHVWAPLGKNSSWPASFFASLLVVLAWGAFLIMGVLDPEGGVKALWPIFGIANQLLAAIALCLATTIILKMALRKPAGTPRRFAPVVATLLPLVWLLAVTLTAGVQKVFHPLPSIGFLAAANVQEGKLPGLTAAATAAPADAAKQTAVRVAETIRFNNRVDAGVTIGFLVLVAIIIAMCVREWLQLLRAAKPTRLHETDPVWLSECDLLTGTGPRHVMGVLALGLALLKELSGEAAVERELAAQAPKACECAAPEQKAVRRNTYLSTTERRFTGIRRCC